MAVKRKMPQSQGKYVKKRKSTKVNKLQVKKMILGLSETKHYHSTYVAEIKTGFQYNINPLYWIPIGSNETSRLGDKIFLESIDMNCKIDRSNVDVGGLGRFKNSSIPFNLKLIRCTSKAKQGTTGDAGFTLLGLPDIRLDALGNFANSHNNLQQFQVVWDYRGTLEQMPVLNAGNDQYNSVMIKKRILINRQVLYDGVETTGSSGFLKDYQYYFYFAVDSNTTAGLSAVFVHSDILVNFKDM